LSEDSDLERTEPPSSRRIEKAREEGQVPQSRELAAFLVMATAAGGLWSLSHWITHGASEIMRGGLSFDRKAAFDSSAMASVLSNLGEQALTLAAPILFLTLMAALITPFLVGGWLFSAKPLSPDLTKMDPIKGIGRMFSMNSVGELVKALLKAFLIGIIIWWVIKYEQDRIFALTSQPIEMALASFGNMLLVALAALVGGLAVIAAIDTPFQLWQYYRRLRMTREEIRQEMKEMEGDPQLKARIRSQQREISRRRMMSNVPKADVIVTNPTHFAVALKYDGDSMGAPQVVAKGMNLVAQKIRSLGEEHHVPVVEAPPLARALYRHAELGDSIPAALYTAVAEVMAYVFRLNQTMASGERPPAPPVSIAVPSGFDPGSPAGVPA